MDCLQMIPIQHGESTHIIPCGKCAFCLKNKRSQWMFRIHHEMRKQEYPGWFVTLTYNEKYVPRTPDRHHLSLRFKDVQRFIKKLRGDGHKKGIKHYVKYICVGEYGGQTQRPHYHLLLWTNCTPEQLQHYWTTKKGQPLGHTHIGRITIKSAMYTLEYIIQPQQPEGCKHFNNKINKIEKPRGQFSRGLGLDYLTSPVYDYHTFDYENPILTSIIDGQQVALPRYYKQKIFTKYQMAKERHKLKWKKTREKRKKMRELKAKGIKNTCKYMKSLDIERANRIMSTTKTKKL